jgi:hypothetical protein
VKHVLETLFENLLRQTFAQRLTEAIANLLGDPSVQLLDHGTDGPIPEAGHLPAPEQATLPHLLTATGLA